MPPSTRPQGVRFKVLRDLLQEAQGLGLSSTTEVCNGLIKPRTEEQKCAYVDTLPADAVADATVFVSHAWRYDLADSIDVMEQHEKEHPGSVFWFDLVMNNQHGTAERPFEWWCHTFQHSIEQIGTVVLVLAPWRRPIPLTRSWCLFEIMCSLNAGREKVDFRIMLPTEQGRAFTNSLIEDHEGALRALSDVRTEESEAFLQSDREMIFKAVEASIGFQKLNSLVNEQMRLWFVQQGIKGTKQLEESGRDLSQDAEFAKSCYQLGSMLLGFGQLDAALVFFAKALEITTKVLGEVHPLVAMQHNSIAIVLSMQGNHEGALQHYGRALAIRKQTLGEAHADTAQIYNNMANVLVNQGRAKEAMQLYAVAVGIREKVLGEEHADTAQTYNNMAVLFASQGDVEFALKCYGKVLRIRQALFGEEHPDTAQTHNNMGIAYLSEGRHAEAVASFQRALAFHEKVLGEGHPDTATTYNNIALAYQHEGELKPALEHFSRAHGVWKSVLGEQHPHTQLAAHNILLVEAALHAESVRASAGDKGSSPKLQSVSGDGEGEVLTGGAIVDRHDENGVEEDREEDRGEEGNTRRREDVEQEEEQEGEEEKEEGKEKEEHEEDKEVGQGQQKHGCCILI